MIGQTLRHYRIESKLGEGGMGTVYKAFDTHLHRAAAIKVLRAGTITNPDRKTRFVREARAASALNHPNIVTIYDIDSADSAGHSVDFIAMEFIEGKTLDEFVVRKPLALAESLKYAVQMADALAAAHAAGIVHRDLKPGNVIVTEKGLVKILDFGLVKLTEPPETDEHASTRTGVAPDTEEGTILGTVAYMSPEQAQGLKVDSRSDIFSFGAVLYEILTGRRPFKGDTKMAILSAVLSHEPKPLSEIVEGVPPELERIIARCLRKDPDRRFQHMEDLKVALQELREESDSGRLAAAPIAARRKGRRGLAVGIAAGFLLATAAGAVAWWLWQGRSRPALSDLTLTRLTSDSGLSYMPALSPDGRLLAYSSDRSGDGNLDIWVKQVAGGEPVRLTRHLAADLEPEFSPDGIRIAFRSERDGRGIYVVSALGGEERRVADQGYLPQWSPDGKWISYGVNTPTFNRIYVVPSTGGQPRELAPEISGARPPIWSPDGKHLLFAGGQDQEYGWWVAPFEGGQAVRTGALPAIRQHKLKILFTLPFVISGVALPSIWRPEENQIVFSAAQGDSTNIWELSLSPKTWQVIGPPRQLTSGTGLEASPSIAAGGSPGERLLAFANVTSNTDVYSLPVDHNQGKPTGEPQRLTREAAADFAPFPSLDVPSVSFLSSRSGRFEVWLKDLASGRETAITLTGDNKVWPVLSPDGSKLAYLINEFDKPELFMISLAPGGHPGVAQRVCEGCGRPTDWSADGRKVIYVESANPHGRVVLLDVSSGEKVDLLRSAQTIRNARLSSDGGWILFNEVFAAREGRLWIAPLKGPLPVPREEWILASQGGLGFQRQGCWAPDANLVYILSDRDGFRCIWAQRLEPGSKRPREAPFPVQHFHGALSMMGIQDDANIGLRATRDRLFFSLVESTGNVWLSRIAAQ